ncbi:MAG: hypothetical protein DMF92_07775 [Acidobacteria bacterium]|nr:MAG: hypothetical protein DMF92_07775 [Acidobacteriota bacterium]
MPGDSRRRIGAGGDARSRRGCPGARGDAPALDEGRARQLTRCAGRDCGDLGLARKTREAADRDSRHACHITGERGRSAPSRIGARARDDSRCRVVRAGVDRVGSAGERRPVRSPTFHRVAPNFVIQGGSPGANEYIGDALFMRDEVGLWPHVRGAVGISTRGRDTGDGQIFVDLVDNPRLDHEFTVFAQLLNGMNVVDAILEGDVIDRIQIVLGP